ncbi:hypothetical protein WDU94_010790 [Cyamophila willieti]
MSAYSLRCLVTSESKNLSTIVEEHESIQGENLMTDRRETTVAFDQNTHLPFDQEMSRDYAGASSFENVHRVPPLSDQEMSRDYAGASSFENVHRVPPLSDQEMSRDYAGASSFENVLRVPPLSDQEMSRDYAGASSFEKFFEYLLSLTKKWNMESQHVFNFQGAQHFQTSAQNGPSQIFIRPILPPYPPPSTRFIPPVPGSLQVPMTRPSSVQPLEITRTDMKKLGANVRLVFAGDSQLVRLTKSWTGPFESWAISGKTVRETMEEVDTRGIQKNGICIVWVGTNDVKLDTFNPSKLREDWKLLFRVIKSRFDHIVIALLISQARRELQGEAGSSEDSDCDDDETEVSHSGSLVVPLPTMSVKAKAERSVHTIKNYLHCMCDEPGDNLKLSRLLMQLRKLPNAEGMSPYMLMLGRDVRTRLDVPMKPKVSIVSECRVSGVSRSFQVYDRVQVRNYTRECKWKFGNIQRREGAVHQWVSLDDGRLWRRSTTAVEEQNPVSSTPAVEGANQSAACFVISPEELRSYPHVADETKKKKRKKGKTMIATDTPNMDELKLKKTKALKADKSKKKKVLFPETHEN